MDISDKKNARSIAALMSTDVKRRRSAARRLGRPGNSPATVSLCQALADSDRYVRRYAAISLGLIGDPGAVEALLTALADRSASVRRHAIQALGVLRDTQAVAPLCERLYDPNLIVRESAIHSLALFGADAVAPLCHLLNAPKARLRQDARRALVLMVEQKTPQVQIRVLANALLPAEERCAYLETLLGCYTEPFSFFLGRRRGYLSSVPDFCGFVLQSEDAADFAAQQGARVVLDYFTLGRASQKDPSTGSDTLLRPVQNQVHTGGADTLLRASEQQAEEPQEPETLLDRLKRWFGIE